MRSVRVVLDPDSEYPPDRIDAALTDFVCDGFNIREALNNWHSAFLDWLSETSSSSVDLQSILATIYYPAISIYLSGIFDYRYQFKGMMTPSLAQSVVEIHVSRILSETKNALNFTNLGCGLLIVPLRIAGARATSLQHKTAIRTMLLQISSRSFIVADSISSDLDALWRSNDPSELRW